MSTFRVSVSARVETNTKLFTFRQLAAILEETYAHKLEPGEEIVCVSVVGGGLEIKTARAVIETRQRETYEPVSEPKQAETAPPEAQGCVDETPAGGRVRGDEALLPIKDMRDREAVLVYLEGSDVPIVGHKAPWWVGTFRIFANHVDKELTDCKLRGWRPLPNVVRPC